MEAELLIRSAIPAERNLLEALQRRASLVWDEYREALLANPDAIILPFEQLVSSQTTVAERKGKIVGFCVVLPRSDGDAELDGLFVEPSDWRGGIGKRLVQHAEIQAQRAGAKFLCVVGNPRAEGFYASCGFKIIGEEHTRFGIGLLMRKELA